MPGMLETHHANEFTDSDMCVTAAAVVGMGCNRHTHVNLFSNDLAITARLVHNR